MGNGVDIIIPIYNAFEDLQICLQSIYRHTDLLHNRLILINDNSPDDRIRTYLDSQCRENVIIIHNEENRGFSNNINLGILQSDDRDVILLNSDTVVTKHWVEKIVNCAYSASSIGTVTPLSNNATLCSVPEFCQENKLPEGMSIDEMAAIVEDCSMKKYPRITVANGFCMMVKREVIKLIGGFDAKTFGRGYGEENDFCNRAEQMGYIHVMCDDTYIYHSGTKSFVSKEKEAYIREHERILVNRYPKQLHDNAVHCRDNPNGWVGRNIAYHMDVHNGRQNVLYLLQSDFREGADDNVGGTQLHVKHLMQGLRQYMNIFVVARDKEYLQVTAYVADKEHIFRFYIGPRENFPVLQRRELAEIFRAILTDFHIDIVHVHHTASTSLDIYYEAEKLGIPIVFTAHDFYYICPGIKMLDSKGKVCIHQEHPDCQECLSKRVGLYHQDAYLNMWREKHEEAMKLCHTIVAPSESAREILCNYYPALQDRIQVIEHGMDAPKMLEVDESQIIYCDDFSWKIEKVDKARRCPFIVGVAFLRDDSVERRRIVLKVSDESGKSLWLPTHYGGNLDVLHTENRFYAYLPNKLLADGLLKIDVFLEKNQKYYTNHQPEYLLKNVIFQNKSVFRVAFIGGINEEKGGCEIAEIIKQGPSDVEWYVFGGIGEENLFRLKKENLIKTGYYYQEDLATLLTYHGIEAICILSKWPETFSYTLSEAVINYIPVIVTDIGALGQRTDKEGYGKKVTVERDASVVEVNRIIQSWKTRGSEYQKFYQMVKQYHHNTVTEMLKKYQNLYSMIIPERPLLPYIVERSQLELINRVSLNGTNVSQDINELVEQKRQLENRLRIIDNSITFKMVRKLTSINIPFKKTIKRLLKI